MLTSRSDMVKPCIPTSEMAVPVVQEEFWQLWEVNRPFLLKLCMRWMNGDLAEASEALSGAMMRAFEGTPEKLPEIGNVRAWLARIVHNHCIDILRQKQHQPFEVEDPDRLLQRLEDNKLLVEASPETGMVRQENYRQVLSEVEALPPRLREVMMLRAYQNMPFKEIADHLNITPATARKRATEARSLLAKRLRADENDPRTRRSADPSAQAPRGERRAADAILARPATPDPQAMRYAHCCHIDIGDGRQIERFLFVARRPVRMAQRLRTLEAYMDRHPAGWTKCNEYAGLLCIEGRFAEAVTHYREVLRRQPHRFLVSEALARCLQVLGRAPEAISVLTSALSMVRSAAHAAHLRALQAYMEADHLRALAAWKQACQLAPGHLHYMLCLAAQWMRMGRFDEALHQLQMHVRQHPMDREGHALLLQTLAATRQKQEYARVMQQTLRKFPGDGLATLQAAMFELQAPELSADQLRDIGKDITLLRTQWPDAALLMHVRAAWLFQRGRLDQCRTAVLNFTQAQPQLREGLRTAAVWLERLGDHDHAATYQNELQRLFPRRSSETEIQSQILWQN